MRTSNVETLLVSGTVDFSTPAQVATDELLPALPNGHQLILAEFGHVNDFWAFQPAASQQLLTAFLDRGEVDASLYSTREVDFEAGAQTLPTIAKILLGIVAAVALLAVALLGWMAFRVRRRGGFGPRTSVWLRSLAPALVGVGGWFLAVLIVLTIWPAMFVGSRLIVVSSMGVAVGLCLQLARVQGDWTAGFRYANLSAALAGSLVGAWLGGYAANGLASALTALIGTILGGNLALLTVDLVRDRRSSSMAPSALPRVATD